MHQTGHPIDLPRDGDGYAASCTSFSVMSDQKVMI